ncbi:MAG: NAD-dependent epimerase/dehydratase family protein [Phycisphaerae bacterium]
MDHPLTDWPAVHGSAFAEMPVLVTGGAGFIGSHLVAALKTLGARVAVLDDLSAGEAANLPTGCKLIQGSIHDEAAMQRAVAGVQVVFHLAALVSVPRSVEMPADYHRINAGGTFQVLQAARAARVSRVIYSASSSAYGDTPQLPKHEAMPERPRSPYAATKLAGEQYVRAWASCYDMDAVSLRYFNIFGPRQKADSAYAGVVAAFARRLLAGERPAVYGDGQASRDFTFVENAVHANLLAAKREADFGGEVVNVATGERRTVLELARAMARLAGRGDLTPEHKPERPGDVTHSLADLARAQQELGYKLLVDFEAGLAATWAWYAKQGR